MKVFIITSKFFYDMAEDVKNTLENAGHTVTMPNHFDAPETESKYRALGQRRHAEWKGNQYKESENKIQECDAVLVLNYEKNGIKDYIGGATFLEMYDAFRHGKKIFLMNPIPIGMLHDEIVGFQPVILDGEMKYFAQI